MRHAHSQPRGMAMVIVMVFVALATIMAYALLNSQSTMVQAGSNGARAAQADALAESGIQLASYYLQNPASAPVLNSSGFYPGQTGVSLGSAVNGTVDITVTQVDSSNYTISSKAHYAASSDTPISRSLGATAAVQYAYVPTDATTMNGGITISPGLTINGSLRSSGGVKLNGGTITGNITAPSVQNLLGSLLGLVNQILTPLDSTAPVASNNQIKDYRTYTYNGKTYSAAILPTAGGTYGATTNNPLGVYYNTGDVTISAATTINGTLLAPQGKLIIKNNLTVTAAQNMPALVINSDISFGASTKTLTATGLSWVGGVISKSGTAINDVTNFTGSAQFAGGAGMIGSGYSGTVTINFDKTKATVANFLPAQGTSAYGVKLTSFSNN